MNIFFLDQDPHQAAIAHYDKHVVKMILENAQMLCTTHNLLGDTTPYRTTHANHPCSIWVRHSIDNYMWLRRLTVALHSEWQHRYNHSRLHKSFAILNTLTPPDLPSNGFTPPPLVMPLDCVVYSPQDKLGGRVQSYRQYYLKHKSHLTAYTNRTPPAWAL